MGGSISALHFEHKVSRKDFTLLLKSKDPQLGEISQMKNKTTGKTVLMKEIEIKTIQNFNDLIQKFTNCLKLHHRNLISIYGFANGDTGDLFTTTSKVQVYFEYLPNNLNQAIKSRRRPFAAASHLETPNTQVQVQYFEESELFGLMLQLINVLEYLQENDVGHGDVRPETCFISDEGIIKLIDRRCICEETSAYEQAREGSRKVFLTPLQMVGLKKNLSELGENKYKADVFGLGMTLLECATLQSSSKLYDWTEFKIDTETLAAKLAEVKNRYSANLYGLLSVMLTLEERNRPDFIELNRILNGEDVVRPSVTSSIIEEDPLESVGILSMHPKLMSVLPQTPHTCQAILIQNSFAHKPVPPPKNLKLTLKVIPREEEAQQNKEGANEMPLSPKITQRVSDRPVKNNNPKQFPARLKKSKSNKLQDIALDQSLARDFEGFSKRKSSKNNTDIYKNLLLDNLESPNISNITSKLPNDSRSTLSLSKRESLNYRPSNLDQASHSILSDPKFSHHITPGLRQSLEAFTPTGGIAYPFNPSKSTTIFPKYTQTSPNGTFVYRSGYSNPFIQQDSNSLASARPFTIKSTSMANYNSMSETSRDMSRNIGYNKSASVKAFPLASSRLETSNSAADLVGTFMHNENLTQREQLMVEDILKKVLNSTGMGSNAPLSTRKESGVMLEPMSTRASNVPSQTGAEGNVVLEKKENPRTLYLAHRSNNSIDSGSRVRPGMNGGRGNDVFGSSQGYSSSFYNTEQNMFPVESQMWQNISSSENKTERRELAKENSSKITPGLRPTGKGLEKSYGNLNHAVKEAQKELIFSKDNVVGQIGGCKLNGRSKSNNFGQSEFFDKNLWSKNPFKNDYTGK